MTVKTRFPPSATGVPLIVSDALSLLVIVPMAGLPDVVTPATVTPLNVTVSVSFDSTLASSPVATVIVRCSPAVPVKFSVPLADS